MRDTENTVQYSPENYTGNKFLGLYNKAVLLQNTLFREQKEKYLNRFTAELKAEFEVESLPICFDQCVTKIDTGLDSNEKNCLRNCYLKRISSRDDFHILLQQMKSVEEAKNAKERLV